MTPPHPSRTTTSEASGGRKPPGSPCVCLLAIALAAPLAHAAEPLKVICASRAAVPPKIAGVVVGDDQIGCDPEIAGL